jgi:hypothetical protein
VLDEPSARAEGRSESGSLGIVADDGPAVQEVGVQVVDRGAELVRVDLRVDVQRVQDVRTREPAVEEGLAERMRDGLLGGGAELTAVEVERAREVERVSRRRRRPRRPAGSRSGPPRS